MKKLFFTTLPLTAVLAGCATSDNVCEDITLASEQIHACQALQRQITNAKGQPLKRTELERRYQQDCVDIRYYREEQQDAICGNKEKLGEIKEELQKEENQ
mgnify:CR=1 FL=1